MRLILIDNNSGFIFGEHLSDQSGDTALIEAARAVDADIGEHGRQYSAQGSAPRDTWRGTHLNPGWRGLRQHGASSRID